MFNKNIILAIRQNQTGYFGEVIKNFNHFGGNCRFGQSDF
jgi:hypothetical protein